MAYKGGTTIKMSALHLTQWVKTEKGEDRLFHLHLFYRVYLIKV